jgi:glycosyltransferase involved in cell wall biosynthesis
MISTFVTAERFTKRPRVLDVDDAIWLLRGGNFARTLARLCDTVVCGNSFIADFFRQSAHRVVVLPTAVDTDRFCPTPEPKEYAPVICWSGTSSGLRYLKAIEKPLAAVLAQDARRRLRVISDLPPALRSLPAAQVEFVRWSEASEVTAIRDAALGIMPLEDSPWSRGKCGYKLLTYMACGLPVVATPLGFNADLLRGDKAGLSAWTPSQWAEAIDCLLSSPERASAMGAAGCRLVRNEFSLKALAPQFARILHSAARN